MTWACDIVLRPLNGIIDCLLKHIFSAYRQNNVQHRQEYTSFGMGLGRAGNFLYTTPNNKKISTGFSEDIFILPISMFPERDISFSIIENPSFFTVK